MTWTIWYAIWDANATGKRLTCYTTMPAPTCIFSASTLKHKIRHLSDGDAEVQSSPLGCKWNKLNWNLVLSDSAKGSGHSFHQKLELWFLPLNPRRLWLVWQHITAQRIFLDYEAQVFEATVLIFAPRRCHYIHSNKTDGGNEGLQGETLPVAIKGIWPVLHKVGTSPSQETPFRLAK